MDHREIDDYNDDDGKIEFTLSSKAISDIPKIKTMQSKLNKPIRIKLQKPTAFRFNSIEASTYNANTSSNQTFTIPPLNAIISTAYGKPAVSGSRSFKLFTAKHTNIRNIQFLNWASTGKNTFDDPNKFRDVILTNYKMKPVFNQLCCGACWAVSTSTAFADRYGILNDESPIEGDIISIMSCCTGNKYKNVFGVVATPDCNIMSNYEQLQMSDSSMGMCSGGIPYSAALSVFRNGIPELSKQTYNKNLFDCNNSYGTDLNSAIITKYPCEKKLFSQNKKIKMNQSEKPTYISSSMDSRGPPEHYVNLMKNALLEGGPIVAGFMTTGDFIGIGSVSQMLNSENVISWDSTGKVYVPGAYNKIWPFLPINSVGGVSTVNFITKDNSKNGPANTEVVDTGLRSEAPIGEIFCGFHAVVIVGWGELDMKYVSNKDVKTITSPVDKRPKLPFWICRNSWGNNWPSKDNKNYYEGGVRVTVNGQEKTLYVPPGYWLHAMYPNESLALDVPIIYEGTDYGSTMVMTPEKNKNNKGPTPKPTTQPPTRSPTLLPTRSPTLLPTRSPTLLPTESPAQSPAQSPTESPTESPAQSPAQSPTECDYEWVDSEGYGCKDYRKEKWCTPDGREGQGWEDRWGKISDFSNQGKDATQACCECGGGEMGTKGDVRNVPGDTENGFGGLGEWGLFGVIIGSLLVVCLVIVLIYYFVNKRNKEMIAQTPLYPTL